MFKILWIVIITLGTSINAWSQNSNKTLIEYLSEMIINKEQVLLGKDYDLLDTDMTSLLKEIKNETEFLDLSLVKFRVSKVIFRGKKTYVVTNNYFLKSNAPGVKILMHYEPKKFELLHKKQLVGDTKTYLLVLKPYKKYSKETVYEVKDSLAFNVIPNTQKRDYNFAITEKELAEFEDIYYLSTNIAALKKEIAGRKKFTTEVGKELANVIVANIK